MPDPVTSIGLEYLMTLHVALEPARVVSTELSLYPGRAGGWIKGPAISGEIVPPSGDWLRSMPNGTKRLDVRIAILADDGSHILMTYHGRIAESAPSGGATSGAGRYFLIGAVFETDSQRYGWLNDIVAVGKNVPDAVGEGRFVTHELYVAR